MKSVAAAYLSSCFFRASIVDVPFRITNRLFITRDYSVVCACLLESTCYRAPKRPTHLCVPCFCQCALESTALRVGMKTLYLDSRHSISQRSALPLEKCTVTSLKYYTFAMQVHSCQSKLFFCNLWYLDLDTGYMFQQSF